MERKDILIFMSDQHSGRIMGCSGDKIVRTPNLNKIAEEGAMFQHAYTPCPLCVPARMSFITGRNAEHTGVYTNSGSIPSDMPTFLHQLGTLGYETVLCGRMHFEGIDQRHGFMKRIAGDITPTVAGACDGAQDRGMFSLAMGEPFCLQIIGGGNSPIQEYDKYVTETAVKYLSQEHEKPQCIVVGTYAPHFPYVVTKELFDYYYDKVQIPETVKEGNDVVHPAERKRITDKQEDVVRAVRAAYYGLVEFTDQCVGEVLDAWKKYLTCNKREGLFVYTSDHGDHVGSHGFYGKQSLYEDVVNIPLLIYGDGVVHSKINNPVSLIDIAPTLCEMNETSLLFTDGTSFWDSICRGEEPEERPVFSEWIMDPFLKGTVYGKMVRYGKYKLITYKDYEKEDLLFIPEEDYWELHPCNESYPQKVQELHEIAYRGIAVEDLVKKKNQREDDYNVITKFNRQNGAINSETWICSRESKILPNDYIQSKQQMHPYIKGMWEKQKERAVKEGTYYEPRE